MKKGKDKNQPLTTGEFQDFADFWVDKVATKDDLKNFVTKNDLKEELKNFATKDDLKNELGAFTTKAIAIFATKDDLKELPTKHDLITFKNEILKSNDKIVGELATVRQEQIMDAGHHHRADKKLEIHEKRIKRLEVQVGVA